MKWYPVSPPFSPSPHRSKHPHSHFPLFFSRFPRFFASAIGVNCLPPSHMDPGIMSSYPSSPHFAPTRLVTCIRVPPPPRAGNDFSVQGFPPPPLPPFLCDVLPFQPTLFVPFALTLVSMVFVLTFFAPPRLAFPAFIPPFPHPPFFYDLHS